MTRLAMLRVWSLDDARMRRFSDKLLALTGDCEG
jgi:hypothetical protein